MNLADFLLARISEDEAMARAAVARPPVEADAVRVVWYRHDTGWVPSAKGEWAEGQALFDRFDPVRVLAECEAKRRIVDWHKAWPVLVEQPPQYETTTDTIGGMAMRVSQQMAWLTQQEYRQRFGDEPPTAAVLSLLALPYADHPDYRQEWEAVKD